MLKSGYQVPVDKTQPVGSDNDSLLQLVRMLAREQARRDHELNTKNEARSNIQ